MASYYLEGYTTPSGVNSREKVKEYQRELGVTADGIWGPKTQSAYEKSLQNSQSKNIWGADSVFSNYYHGILGQMNIPTISIDVPSREEIQKDLEASLRPSVDSAITRRREQGEVNKAELDADAASRGMGSSTYVSSMKDRENDDVEDDIADMETNYASVLAQNIAQQLQYYTGLQADIARQNAQFQFTAQQNAFNLASSLYQNYLSNQSRASSSSSGGSSSRSTSQSRTVSKQTCYEYVSVLSPVERERLFDSNDTYWESRRQEMVDSLGVSGYMDVVRAYR